jgi:hypothetical protein
VVPDFLVHLPIGVRPTRLTCPFAGWPECSHRSHKRPSNLLALDRNPRSSYARPQALRHVGVRFGNHDLNCPGDWKLGWLASHDESFRAAYSSTSGPNLGRPAAEARYWAFPVWYPGSCAGRKVNERSMKLCAHDAAGRLPPRGTATISPTQECAFFDSGARMPVAQASETTPFQMNDGCR